MGAEDVLIVGAGPTGMVLAMILKLHNVRFRIICASSGPGTLSRAMGVQARTLELYRPFGLDKRAVEEGIQTKESKIRIPGSNGKPRQVAVMPLNRIGQGLSLYPYVLQFAQDDHEQMLLDKLAVLGVEIEWNTRLVSLQQTAHGVSCMLAGIRGEQKGTFSYVVGADGSHSQVRRELGVNFVGGTYEQPFFVADVKMDEAEPEDFAVTVSSQSMVVRLPIRKTGMTRLIGLVPKNFQDKHNIVFEDIKETTEGLLGVKIVEVNWFSPYHVHHRVAEKYRVGSVFMAGDACHVHSPLGGQGMNTGIGDVINLGWKLSSVINGQASEEILDSYEAERRSFALKLVSTTDKAFSIIMHDSWWGSLVRRWLWPFFMSLMTRFTFVKLAGFRTISQIMIAYTTSILSFGSAGAVKAGQRLPWVNYGPGKDNFADFDGLNWQIHVYGTAAVDAQELSWIAMKRYPYDALAKKAGIKENSVFLLRPDSYIGLAMIGYNHAKLQDYVARFQLRP